VHFQIQSARILLVVFTDGFDNLSLNCREDSAKIIKRLEATLDASGNRRCWVVYLGFGDPAEHSTQATSMGVSQERTHTSGDMRKVAELGINEITSHFSKK
jgi:hypothetical protein